MEEVQVTRRALVAVLFAAGLAAALVPMTARAVEGPPACGTPGAPLEVERTYEPGDARTYDYVEFAVPSDTPATTRIEVGYEWVDHAAEAGVPANPVTDTLVPSVFDLGLWEGTIAADSGFRGWSGSRQGRLDRGQAPVWVAEADAERGYLPGGITPGSWFVEIGVAAVGPMGATVHVKITCRSDIGAGTFVDDPVDPTHVAAGEPGWYHGDFHLHAYHSHPSGPGPAAMVQLARDARLEIVPVTEYGTTQPWRELGQVQRGNPDLLIWPGREIITYFGHAITLNETTLDGTPVAEYRHGFTPPGGDTISLGRIQTDIVDNGGLFGVAHPTFFPGPLFRGFCRGCEFELGGAIHWAAVDTIEVLTGPVLTDLSDAHGSFPSTSAHGLSAQQPFVESAIDYWEERLLDGHKVAPVSGSDSKGVEGEDQRARKGYGSSATAVYADALSRAEVTESIRAGRVYVRTRGVEDSPALDLTVRTADTTYHKAFGAVIDADVATMDVTVTDGAGQLLRVTRNGTPVAWLPISSDAATISVPIHRVPAEERTDRPGEDLGTFWRVDTLDARSLTTIGNAVFLTG